MTVTTYIPILYFVQFYIHRLALLFTLYGIQQVGNNSHFIVHQAELFARCEKYRGSSLELD